MAHAIQIGADPQLMDYTLPEPAYNGVKWAMQDVDYDSGRMADGTMRRNRVARKRKVNVTWPPMKPYDVSRVLSSVTAQEFYVRCFDFEKGDWDTMLVYVGDRTIPFLSEALGLCDSFTIDFIEV